MNKIKTWIWNHIICKYFKGYIDDYTNDYIWENSDEVKEILR